MARMTLSELETVGRPLFAAVLGFVIGLERESAGQAAGERTHALVALGSAAFALLSVTASPDPTRPAWRRASSQVSAFWALARS